MILDYINKKFHCHCHCHCQTKYINVETKDDASLNNFINELINLNIIANMNIEPNVNQSDNYAIFENLLTYAKNKHLPVRRKKF